MLIDARWSSFAGKLAKQPKQKSSKSTEALPAHPPLHDVQPLASPLPLAWAMPYVPTDLGPSYAVAEAVPM